MSKLDRIRGAMYGVAVGDALGAPLEFMDAATIQRMHGTVQNMIGGGWLGVRPGECTDDTAMTLAVARGIAEAPYYPVEAIGRHFVEWYNGGPKDIGATCAASIREAIRMAVDKAEPSAFIWKHAAEAAHAILNGKTAGNGSLMRTAYVGLYYQDEFKAILKAWQISKMTHFDNQAAELCAVYTSLINKMVKESRLRSRRQILIKGGVCGMDYTGFEPWPTGYVVDSFEAAIYCVYKTKSFEEAVIKAVNLGGDADTIGAITGGLAGALYGFKAIPERWTKYLSPEVCAEIEELCEVAAEQQERKEETV